MPDTHFDHSLSFLLRGGEVVQTNAVESALWLMGRLKAKPVINAYHLGDVAHNSEAESTFSRMGQKLR